MDGTERQLRDLIDRDAIWQVMVRLARGLDRRDRDLVLSCYHDDAIDDHHVFIGTAASFVDWALDFAERTGVAYHHILSNHCCELDGDDAHAETYYTFSGINLTPPHSLSFGRYIDHFQRRNGEWRIANRVCVMEGRLEVPTGSIPAALGVPLPATFDKTDLSYMRPVAPRQPATTDG